MTTQHLWFASVNNNSRFLKCINFKNEKGFQPCSSSQFSERSFGGLNFMQTPITSEERSRNLKILQKNFQIIHVSRLH